MDLQRFLKLLATNSIPITNTNLQITVEFGSDPVAVPWRFYDVIADMSAGIDFGCEFIGESCAHSRSSMTAKVCCAECFNNLGFLKTVYARRLEEYAYSFIPRFGYWREDGCILPRNMRSPTCNSFICKHAKPTLSAEQHVLLDIMENLALAWRHYKSWNKFAIGVPQQEPYRFVDNRTILSKYVKELAEVREERKAAINFEEEHWITCSKTLQMQSKITLRNVKRGGTSNRSFTAISYSGAFGS